MECKCGGKIIDIFYRTESGSVDYDYSCCDWCMRIVITDGGPINGWNWGKQE